MKDLIVLTADLDAKEGLTSLLSRHHSLNTRPIAFDTFKHDERDSGVWKKAENFLRPFHRQYQYTLVIFDFEGCGQEQKDGIAKLQDKLEQRLFDNGWDNRARVIIFVPELEIWVWANSSSVDECLKWNNQQTDLRTWLKQQDLLDPGATKPARPKEALEKALIHLHRPWSSSIFRELGQKVSPRSCTDPAFLRLKETLQRWFPVE